MKKKTDSKKGEYIHAFCNKIKHEKALTHWGRVTHIYVSKLNIMDSDNACRLAGTKPSSEPMQKYW